MKIFTIIISVILVLSISPIAMSSIDKKQTLIFNEKNFAQPYENKLSPGMLLSDAPYLKTLYLNNDGENKIYPIDLEITGEISTWIEEIDEDVVLGYIQDLVDFGPRVTATTACDLAGDYIYSEFENMGLDVRKHSWTQGSLYGDNIEGTLYGIDDNSDEIYIVCGHYDSVTGSPGADDNAAGTAAILAAAQVMSQYEFNHTVRFVAFSGEEQGLIGSSYYCEEAEINEDNIIAALNADMIGYAETDDDASKIEIFTNTASEWILDFSEDVSLEYEDLIGLSIINSGFASNSDHYSFWTSGYDAVMYHEYHFNPYYHSPEDTIDKMNMDYDMRVSRLIMATLAELSDPIVLSASFSYAPQYPHPGEAIQFTDQSLGDITSYSWNFGDGETSNLKNPTHSYSEEGQYLVKLTVYNSDGGSDTFSQNIEIWDNWAPEAVANPEFYAGNNPSVNFDGSSSWDPDGTVESYLWDFDDGSTSTLIQPTHLFSEDGLYDVTLIVTDNQAKQSNAFHCDIRIDAYTPPITNVTILGTEGNNGWMKSQVQLKFESFDWTGVDYTKYRIDNNQWQTYNPSDLPLIMSDGVHTVDYYSVDIYGNVENQKTEILRIDKEKPELTYGVEGETIEEFYISNVIITCSGNDQESGLAHIMYQFIDQPEWKLYTNPIEIVEDGIYSIRIYAEDIAGNRKYQSNQGPIEIKIDTEPPETEMILEGDLQPDGWYDGQVTISFEGEDTAGIDLTYYKINEGDWVNYQNQFTLLDRGLHSISYYSIDILGREELVDTTDIQIGSPPTIPTIDGPTDGKANEEQTWTVSSTHPEETTLEFFVDWGDGETTDWFGPYSSGEEVEITHTYTEKKVNTLRVKARDQWGGESDWGTFEFHTSKNKQKNDLRFSNLWSLLFGTIKDLIKLNIRLILEKINLNI